MFTDRTWLWLAAAFYLAGFVLGSVSMLRARRHPRALMYAIVAGGFILQTLGLYARGLAVKGCPIGNTFELFQFTAWSAIALYLVVGVTFRLSLLGYFTATLATALTLLSLVIPVWDATRRIGAFGGNYWIEFHAALALFSYGVFGLLALTSVMWLLQFFSLKQHHLRGMFSFLPSILELDHINLRLLATGVVLLGASLAVGSVYWLDDTGTVNAPKLVATVAVWVAYTVALGLRLADRLITKRLAWTCILLFAAAILSLWPVDSSRRNLDTAGRTFESAPATGSAGILPADDAQRRPQAAPALTPAA
ncbi:cytochrome c biogenesis protein CcsA [Termitidicoccus mucosus]|uniref:cytochrome C assembly family protein n=1 Tax=Termitidicoccus mucosus TaxID=1184151 RepID=UPI003182C6E1